MDFHFSPQALDAAALGRTLVNPGAGACVTFEGRVRDSNEGRTVVALEYEAFGELAVKEGRRILEEARTRFPILGAACVHRTGRLGLGEVAVWVGVTAAHRGPAFEACRFVIDEVKARVPIWKKEHYAGGASEWINGAADHPAPPRAPGP